MVLHLSKCYAFLAVFAICCVHFAKVQYTDLIPLEYAFVSSTRTDYGFTKNMVAYSYIGYNFRLDVCCAMMTGLKSLG
ncbi:MAG: hypothetical protein Tsb0033_14620 [Winogradskyella sp.]